MRPGTRVGALPSGCSLSFATDALAARRCCLVTVFGGQHLSPHTAFSLWVGALDAHRREYLDTARLEPGQCPFVLISPGLCGIIPTSPFAPPENKIGDQDKTELARVHPVHPSSWSMAQWHAPWHPWHLSWQPAPGGRRAEAQESPIPEHLQENIGEFDHFRAGNFGISQPIADFRAK